MAPSEMVGYLASALVLLTFCMKTMMPLRLFAIGSNIAFIVYAAMAALYPVLVLHAILLPLNVYRTISLMRLLRRVRDAARGDLSIEWLKPFMTRLHLPRDQVVFRRGETADRLYFIVSGEVDLPEINVRLAPGVLFGEIAMFAPDRARTASAVCRTDTELLWITSVDLMQICYQQPALSFHLLRLITRRLTENTGPSMRMETPLDARAT
jgi:CRP/FNR family transcriptional regulator, cyclic AMP receptor protein